MPTRSAWTSISGVMVLVAAFMEGAREHGTRG